MKIKHLGHASFLVKTNNKKFLLDPWIKGKCFFKSWSPLVNIDFQKDIGPHDYLWFSHEHPDHFHPETVSLIFDYLKKNNLPTVIFQKTFDKKILNFFKSQFDVKIKELGDNDVLNISDNVKVKITGAGVYDSFIQIKDNNFCFTHLNDCFFSNVQNLKSAKVFSKDKINILSSQFSLAHLPCDPRDENAIKKYMNGKIELLLEQINYLKPNYFIPSSSSVHFCHEENQHMNKTRINPYYLFSKVKGVQCLMGDNSKYFNFEEKLIEVDKENIRLSNLYDKLLKKTENNVLVLGKKIDQNTLTKCIKERARKIKSENNIIILKLLSFFGVIMNKCDFYIKDLNLFFNIDLVAEKIDNLKVNDGYIEISSQMFYNLYNSNFSVDSLIASGAFRLKNYQVAGLNNHLNIMTLNNAGIYLRIRSLLNYRLISKLFNIIKNNVYFRLTH